MKVIERAWRSYRASCVPKAASRRQLKETRQAFYAGGAILFSTMTGQHFFDGFGENDIEPTNDDIAKKQAVQNEIDIYSALFQRICRNHIEPTDNDMAKMNAIQDEIDIFGAELDLKVLGIRRH